MLQEKIKNLLSFSGISLIIGIVGGLSTYLSILVTDWNSKISLKWLVLILYISFTVFLILLKLLIELNLELKKKHTNTSSVVRYIPERETFLISKNDYLGHSAMVSLFYFDDSLEIEFCKGYVKNIQDNFIQIKTLEISNDFISNYENILTKINSNDAIILQKLIVKSYITYTN
ncbi:hypothetical protein B4N84_18230 [Flavobacterium sp. IR1]|nr:hypothetical protein B4N84_18230 [Flavobacterium sp. IR1]